VPGGWDRAATPEGCSARSVLTGAWARLWGPRVCYGGKGVGDAGLWAQAVTQEAQDRPRRPPEAEPRLRLETARRLSAHGLDQEG
jgi:hypothetical protein